MFPIMCLYFCIPCTEVESGPGCSPETSEPPSEELPASPFLFPDYTWQIRSTMSPIGDFFPFKGQNMHLRVVQNKNVTLNSVVCSMIAAVFRHKLHLSCELPCPYYVFSIAAIPFRTCIFCYSSGSRL